MKAERKRKEQLRKDSVKPESTVTVEEVIVANDSNTTPSLLDKVIKETNSLFDNIFGGGNKK